MSVRAMSWVWDHSRSKPTQRLVLLAIADCANDRGTEAYPSNATLAAKTGLTDRAVRRTVGELVELGELAVDYKSGPRGCNRYRVIMRDADPLSPGRRVPRTESPPDGESTHPDRRSAYPDSQSENPDSPSPEPSEPSKTRPEPSESEPATPARPEIDELCTHLADRIEGNGCKRPTITQRWRDAARLMLDADGRSVDKVHRAIDWCQDDEFWRANILSMPKLRVKYDQLQLAARRNGSRASPKPSTTDARMAAAQALKQTMAAPTRLEITDG